MTPEQRLAFCAQTATARRKALEDAPPEISEHGWSTLNFLFTGSTEQQKEPGAA